MYTQSCTLHCRGLAAKYHMPMELAYSLATLALYDVIIYCDDSGSMAFEENGERINDLKLMVGRVADVSTMFDEDGILVRFMNGTLEGNGIRDSASAGQLISQVIACHRMTSCCLLLESPAANLSLGFMAVLWTKLVTSEAVLQLARSLVRRVLAAACLNTASCLLSKTCRKSHPWLHSGTADSTHIRDSASAAQRIRQVSTCCLLSMHADVQTIQQVYSGSSYLKPVARF